MTLDFCGLSSCPLSSHGWTTSWTTTRYSGLLSVNSCVSPVLCERRADVVLAQRHTKSCCRNLHVERRNLRSLAEVIKGSKYVAQKVSCLSAAHVKETSHGDGSLPLRQVRLEGLGLLRDRQSNSNLWYTRHNVSKLRQLALSLYNAGDSRMLFSQRLRSQRVCTC